MQIRRRKRITWLVSINYHIVSITIWTILSEFSYFFDFYWNNNSCRIIDNCRIIMLSALETKKNCLVLFRKVLFIRINIIKVSNILNLLRLNIRSVSNLRCILQNLRPAHDSSLYLKDIKWSELLQWVKN